MPADSLPKKNSSGISILLKTFKNWKTADGSWESFRALSKVLKSPSKVEHPRFRQRPAVRAHHPEELGQGRDQVQCSRLRREGERRQLLLNRTAVVCKRQMLQPPTDSGFYSGVLEADGAKPSSGDRVGRVEEPANVQEAHLEVGEEL